ncbi:MAG: type II toxin-antitoxin system RelE/ParE family toxin [Pseudomonadales bacterium]|nr:type II toxin-antitoxin system RelE/ParE family toxin [Pseudomonadales bacterium]
MLEVRKTRMFARWFDRLKDRKARARIALRIDRLSFGHFGDTRPVGSGISELRIFYGGGYRVYFVRRGEAMIVLLSGGDKSTQQADIAKAKVLAKQLDE